MSQNQGAVIVTGASGFIGRHVMAKLGPERALALSVRAGDNIMAKLDSSCMGRLPTALIHAGGRAHRRKGSSSAEANAQRRDNHELTCALARTAWARGIDRFVFVSTVHVLAAHTEPGRPLRGDELPSPRSNYARAKLAAESELTQIAAASGLEVAVVRPSLVYGAGAGGNLVRLARAIEVGIPLPFGVVKNRRSLMNVSDLADLLVILADLDRPPDAPLLAADAVPISTSNLIRELGQALGQRARLVAVPADLVRAGLRLIARDSMAEQLLDDLEIDIAATIAATGWRPRRSISEGLAAFAAARRPARG